MNYQHVSGVSKRVVQLLDSAKNGLPTNSAMHLHEKFLLLMWYRVQPVYGCQQNVH